MANTKKEKGKKKLDKMTSSCVSKKKLATKKISERGWDLENHAYYRMDMANRHKKEECKKKPINQRKKNKQKPFSPWNKFLFLDISEIKRTECKKGKKEETKAHS